MDEFRAQMLNDNRIREIHDYIEASDCFPGVQIKGGVSYFLWNRDVPGDCKFVTYREGKVGGSAIRPLLEPKSDVLIRFNEAVPIFHKVVDITNHFLSEIVSSRRPFGLSSTFRGNATKGNGDLCLYGKGGATSYVSSAQISDNGCANYWKVFIPFLGPGNDNFPHMVLGKPFIGAPGDVCTETYLTIGPLGSREECASLISYLETRFARFMVLLRKPSQNATRKVYEFVPLVRFDHIWSDDELFETFGITADEQSFIKSLVKEMDLGDANER